MKSVFPFKFWPSEHGKCVISYKPFQKYVVEMAKGQPSGWYAYSVEFKSRTEAEVVVFGMADSYFGGIGKEVFRFDVRCPTSESDEAVVQEASRLAVEIRKQQIFYSEQEKIDAIQTSIISASFE